MRLPPLPQMDLGELTALLTHELLLDMLSLRLLTAQLPGLSPTVNAQRD